MIFPFVQTDFGRRARRPSSSRNGQRRPSLRHCYPEALPGDDLYYYYPEMIGPMGNVEINSRQELQSWLLVARPVSAEEAEAKGGCIKFTPLHADHTQPSEEPHYFCITDPDDVVYGRAHYIPASTPTEKVKLLEAGQPVEGKVVTSTDGEDTLTQSDMSATSSFYERSERG